MFTGCGGTATAFLCGRGDAVLVAAAPAAIDERAIAPADSSRRSPAELVAAALDAPSLGRSDASPSAIEGLAPAERDPVIDALAAAVGRDAPPMLGDDGAAALLAAGWELGFHTRRHDLLTGLDDDVLAAALRPEPIGGDGLPAHARLPARQGRRPRGARGSQRGLRCRVHRQQRSGS